MKAFQDLSDALASAVEKAGAYTVLVNARRRLPATGIAYEADYVLTANHVVERDEEISVMLPDGSEVSATVAGRDPGTDLALLKLEKGNANPAQTGEPARIGEMVLALGRPTAEGIQASLGIVSAVGGPVRTRRGGSLGAHIRTDAIPYPGFSGGPLIDAHGRALGINTSGLGGSGSTAIPIEIAWNVAASLKEHGSVKRGYLGIRGQLAELPRDALKREQHTGVLLVGIEKDSPAEAAGLMVGDIIVGFNGQEVRDHEDLVASLVGDAVGSPAPLELLRGGKPENVQVTLSERAEPEGGEDFSMPFMHGGRHGYRFSHRVPRGHGGPRRFRWRVERHDHDGE